MLAGRRRILRRMNDLSTSQCWLGVSRMYHPAPPTTHAPGGGGQGGGEAGRGRGARGRLTQDTPYCDRWFGGKFEERDEYTGKHSIWKSLDKDKVVRILGIEMDKGKSMEEAMRVLETELIRDPTFKALFEGMRAGAPAAQGSDGTRTCVNNQEMKEEADYTDVAVESEEASAKWCTKLLEV